MNNIDFINKDLISSRSQIEMEKKRNHYIKMLKIKDEIKRLEGINRLAHFVRLFRKYGDC